MSRRDIILYTGHYGAEHITKIIGDFGRYEIARKDLKRVYKKGLITDSERERLNSMLSSSDEENKELALIIINNFLKDEHRQHTRNKPTRKQHPFERFRR